MESEAATDAPLVLVADDLPASREFLTDVLTRDGYRVVAVEDGEAALEAVDRAHPDLVLLDVMMPGLGGFAVCESLKHDPATRLIPVVLITALHERQHRLYAINVGADDFLSKPVDLHELRARVRSLLRLKRYTDDLDSAEAVILSLALTIEARDSCTDGHCQRLAQYASGVGQALGMTEADVKALVHGGFLHDLGKVGIPDGILLKPGSLTAAEFEVMKTHTLIGDRLCGELQSLARVRPIIRHHHERLDGSGYPDGLRGDDIPLIAQVIGIVDVFDALTTTRPYRSALAHAEAFSELYREAALGWRRRDLVDAFEKAFTAGHLTTALPDGIAQRLQAFARQPGSAV